MGVYTIACVHSIKHSVLKRKNLFILSNSGRDDLVRIMFYTITLTARYRDYTFSTICISHPKELMPYFQLCSSTIMTLDICPWPLLQDGFWMQQFSVLFLSITRQMKCVCVETWNKQDIIYSWLASLPISGAFSWSFWYYLKWSDMDNYLL